MRRVTIAVAVSQALLLAACQTAPQLFLPLPGAPLAGPPPAPRAKCVMDFWGNCTPIAGSRHAYRWRYVRPGGKPGTTGKEAAAHSHLCHPRRRVVGEERSSKAEAQKAADSAWMGAVRYDFGERYQDLNRARDVRQS